MENAQALAKLEAMSEDEFQTFFHTLPVRVQWLVKSGAVRWQDALPQWYVRESLKVPTVEYAGVDPADIPF